MQKTFRNRTRLNEDVCEKYAIDDQNQKFREYSIPNYWTHEDHSDRNTYINSVDEDVGIYQSNNFNGFNQAIKENPRTRDGQKWNIITSTGSRAEKQLSTSEFLGPPYSPSTTTAIFEPDVYSKLVMGELSKDKGAILRGKTIDRFVPLVPYLRDEIQHERHIIPKYWVRGGMDTRSVIRNIDYMKTCGLKKN